MNKQYSAGAHLLIELTNGKIYEGNFCYGNNSKITVTDVSEYPSKIKYDSMFSFYQMEILSIKVFNDNLSNAYVNDYEENMTVKFKELQELAHKYKYLSVVDSRYYAVVENLKLCTEITVFGFGNAFARNTRISLLAIGTIQEIFIFDVKISGDRVFDAGIRDILQSKNIKKVVHNSKILADCLEHAHKVRLQNVFDTQVVDYMFTMKRENEVEEMRSFADCVYKYLEIPANIIKNAEISQKQVFDRPVPENIKLNASILVAHLHYLKEFMYNKIMLNINLMTNCYMNCMRNEDYADSLKYLNNNVPQEVRDLGLKI